MSHYIVRNLVDQEKTLGDLIQSSTGLEYWEDFKSISKEAARTLLRGKKIPPLSDIMIVVSYTGKRGQGFYSREGFTTKTSDLLVFEPGWHDAGRYHMPTLVIINSDVDGDEFRGIFRTYKKIPYKVDPEAEEIDIKALSDDVIEYFACALDLSYIDRFPNLKRLMYETMNDDCWIKIDLSPLTQCRTLEEVALDTGCGSPLDLEPLLDINLHRLWYQDYRQDIRIDARGTPDEVHEVIREYQREKLPPKQKTQSLEQIIMKEWQPKFDLDESIAQFGSRDRPLTNADVKGATPLAKTLTIEGPWSDDLDLSPLSVCKDADRLKICFVDNFRLSSFPTMNGIKKITFSDLSGDVVIDECSSFPNLKTFGIFKSPTVESINLDGLTPHENLKYIKIKDAGIKSLDLSPLSDLSQLSDLTIESSSMEEIDLTPLKDCESLRTFNLLFNKKLQGIDLSGLPSGIRDINVTCSDLGTLDLSPLRNFSFLERLDISSNNLSEIDLSPLTQCPNLHGIYLESNPVGIIDLTPLKACPRIKRVDLSKMQLSKLDLSPFEGSRIRDIYLSQNPLKELDLTPLSKCRDLKRIYLMFCDKLEVLDVTPVLSFDCDVSYHENTTLVADKRFHTDTWDRVKWY